jgi:hypothetical protein
MAQKASQAISRPLLLKQFKQNFADAQKQYQFLAQHLPAGKFPKRISPIQTAMSLVTLIGGVVAFTLALCFTFMNKPKTKLRIRKLNVF